MFDKLIFLIILMCRCSVVLGVYYYLWYGCYLKWFCHSTNYYGLVCSVATEPNFKEWITTTKVYDKFHEMVSFNFSNISSKKAIIFHESVSSNIQLSIVASTECNYFVFHRLELQWWENILTSQMHIFLY